MRTDPLTPKQRQFYRLLVAFIRENGHSPTVRELCGLAGFRSTRTVTQYLDSLQAAGVITREEGGSRNIRLNFSAMGVSNGILMVPVIGRVAAGQPILAEENVVDEIAVSRSIARGPHHYFFLEVHGDSMDLAGIDDGGFVLVRQQESGADGEIVVALIDDSATVKRLCMADTAAILQPHSSNPRNKPIVVGHDFRIQGVVVAAFHRTELYSSEP
jgi:repressor LexA